MTETEALEVVKRVQLAAVKSRSNIAESGTEDRVAEYLFPWLYGDRCLLRATTTILERGSVTGMELYNLMSILHTLDGGKLGHLLGVFCAVWGIDDFPEPDLQWIKGFSEESPQTA